MTGRRHLSDAGAQYDSATGEIYVSIIGGFKIGGVSGSDKDILRLTPDGGAPGGTARIPGSI